MVLQNWPQNISTTVRMRENGLNVSITRWIISCIWFENNHFFLCLSFFGKFYSTIKFSCLEALSELFITHWSYQSKANKKLNFEHVSLKILSKNWPTQRQFTIKQEQDCSYIRAKPWMFFWLHLKPIENLFYWIIDKLIEKIFFFHFFIILSPQTLYKILRVCLASRIVTTGLNAIWSALIFFLRLL